MGDFEDVFGAGADAADIIDSYAREGYERSSAKKKANWRGFGVRATSEDISYQSELDRWRMSMISRGYTKGPEFSTYEELSAWDRVNKRPHIRRRNGNGFEVFFTDR